VLGPLVETLVQGSIRDHGLQVHFYRDYENPKDRRTRVHEVDFVAERVDGAVLPVEVKFRKRIDPADIAGVRHFFAKFECPLSVVVTRDLSRWDERERVLYTPLQNFLLAF
jgi:predicted AAA+ superfamily ATPase